MAFPQDRLPIRLEMAFGADPASDPAGWTWSDVSDDVHQQQITVRRGRADESSHTQPTSTTVQLDNPRGDYTPGHPSGAHYPNVRQGVPARLSVQAGGAYLLVRDAIGAQARVTSTAALTVAADLDVAVEMALDRIPAQWPANPPTGFGPYEQATQEILGRYNPTGDNRMWALLINEDGTPVLRWSTTGADLVQAPATRPLPVAAGQRTAIRATLDVDNGAGGYTVTYYTAAGVDGPWRPLGDPVTGAGVTTIYQAGTADLEVGDLLVPAFRQGAGRYFRAQLRDGIGGPLLADADFTTLEPGATAWTDSAGRAWTVGGTAEVTDWRTRVIGQVAEWAPAWPWGDLSDEADPTGRPGEARTGITIAGILRRLGQGVQPLQSTLRRRIASYAPGAYWPMEDGPTATQAYSPIEGVRPMRTIGLDFAADSTLPGSAPLPRLTEDASIFGAVPLMASGEWRMEMAYYLDALPATSQMLLQVRTTSRPWNVLEIRVTATTVQVIGYDTSTDSSSSSLLINLPAATTVPFTGSWNRLILSAETSGSDVVLTLQWTSVAGGGTSTTDVYTGTVGRVTQIASEPGPELAGMSIGHIAVLTDAGSIAFNGADDGYDGELALTRLRRLAEEERLPMSVLGDAEESPAMGPQGIATVLDLIRECVAADGGILYELRDAIGLGYLPRDVLYNRPAALELSARGNEIDNPFAPVLDDQRLRNDVTVTRSGGSAARAVDDQSIAERGLYDESITLSLGDDEDVEPAAYWRLHRGTWPGMRYPAVTTALDLAPHLIPGWLERAEGDRVAVADLPPQHPAAAVDLMVEGLTETISPTRWVIEATCSPGGVWDVGEIGQDDPADDDAPVHIDTDGSELDASVDAGDTALIVRAYDGPAWVTSAGPTVTDDGDLPVTIAIGGEHMTVSAVEPLLWDAFTRTESNGWGTTPAAVVPAPTWSLSGGAAAERSVNGAAGLVTVGDTTVPRYQFMQQWTVADGELLTTVTAPAVATGAAMGITLLMRITGAAYYGVRAVLQTSGAVGIQAMRDATTSLTSITGAGAVYAAGTVLRIRARVDDHRIRGRVWPANRPEPAHWQLDTTVATGQLTTGPAGIAMDRAVGNTNISPQFAVADWEMVTPQLFTVTRSTNGVFKSHASGADVRLAHPMILAW